MYFRSYLRAPASLLPSIYPFARSSTVEVTEEEDLWLVRLGGNAPRLNKPVKTKKNACTGGVTTDSTAWWKNPIASQPSTLLFSMPLGDLIVFYQSRWRRKQFVRVARGVYPWWNTSSLVRRRVTNVWRSNATIWEKNVGMRGGMRSWTKITTVTRSRRLLETDNAPGCGGIIRTRSFVLSAPTDVCFRYLW